MTNLYDFLRNIHDRATIGDQIIGSIKLSTEEVLWIEQFLKAPDFEIHFKSTKVQDLPGEENTYAMHFALKGDEQDIFSLITEAMLQNPNFAHLMCAAREYYFDHGTTCPECHEAFTSEIRPSGWNFEPHKPI